MTYHVILVNNVVITHGEEWKYHKGWKYRNDISPRGEDIVYWVMILSRTGTTLARKHAV